MMPHMFRSLTRGLLMFMLLFCVIQTDAFAADRKTVGITEFQNETAVTDLPLANLISGILTEELVTNRSLRLLDQDSLQQALAAGGLTTASLFDKSPELKPGQAAGVNYLICGRIKEASSQVVQLNGFQQLRARVVLTVRIINSASGNIVYAEMTTGEARKTFLLDKKNTEPVDTAANRAAVLEEAIRKAVAKAAGKMNSLQPVTGTILKVNQAEKTVILDLGSEQGVSLNQPYQIYIETAPLIHPVSKMEIGNETREVAGLKITKIFPAYSVAEIVSGQISEVQPGQLVRKTPLP